MSEQGDRYWTITACNGTLVWVRSVPVNNHLSCKFFPYGTPGSFVPARYLADRYCEEDQQQLCSFTDEAEVLAQIEALQALGVMARANAYQVKQ